MLAELAGDELIKPVGEPDSVKLCVAPDVALRTVPPVPPVPPLVAGSVCVGLNECNVSGTYVSLALGDALGVTLLVARTSAVSENMSAKNARILFSRGLRGCCRAPLTWART